MGDASSFIVIYNAFAWVAIFCWDNGILRWGNNTAMNHSLCCSSGILKLIWLNSVLNLWSTSHTDSIISYLIYFIFVIHCDCDFDFLNSTFSAVLVLARRICIHRNIFMYQDNYLSCNVVIKCAFFIFSYVTFCEVHTTSTTNQKFSWSFVPLNTPSSGVQPWWMWEVEVEVDGNNGMEWWWGWMAGEFP